MSDPESIKIHYLRLPDRLTVFDQRVVLRRKDVIVTLSQPVDVASPMMADGRVMLETGSLAVWFTFPGAWHDIGRFHTADGTFSGTYSNILTPPVIDGAVWHTTDLFLDIWWPAGGEVTLLDEDEFEDAVTHGHMDEETTRRARVEADRLLERARAGTWPPAIVGEWTLERALAELSSNSG